MARREDLKAHERSFREVALTFPDATEDFPWGHSAFKVRGKTFLFLSLDDERLGLSVKLPLSQSMALAFPFAEPTHYGLGKAGWVSASFGPGSDVPVGLLRAWIDESYRAIAPKKLVALLDGGGTGTKAPKPIDRSKRPARDRSGPRSGTAARRGTRRSP